jgi:hypothetical protein
MQRIEINVNTGEVTVVDLTPEEEAAVLAAKAAWDEANSLDIRAARAVDGIDRLQFEHLFDLENRTRVLEGLGQITRAQYRNALINRWKSLNS